MAVDYRHREPPATAEQIAALERRLGTALPDDYRAYLAGQDGGRLVPNSEGAKYVFGLRDDLAGYVNMDHKLQVYSDRVPSWLLPVADDAAGNLFALSLRDKDKGSVWFWDHEEEADEDEPPTEDNIEHRADSWTVFLDGLTALDAG